MGKRYISIEREGEYGVYRGNSLQYIDIVSESVSSDHQMIDIETAGEREWRHRVPGPYRVGGDVDIVVNADNVGKFLLWVLGNKVTSAPSSGAYRHTFESAQEFDSFSMNIAPAVQDTIAGGLGGYAMRRVVGCGITSMTFEAVAGEALTSTVSVIGRTETLVSDAQAPSFSTVRPFIFYEGNVSVNGVVVANVEAFRLTIENNIDDAAFVLGSRFLPGLRIQGITITGDMDLAFTDWDQYRLFYDGTALGTTPSSTTHGSVDLNLLMTGLTNASGGLYPNYRLEFELPKCYYDTTDANFDRRDRIVQSVTFTATYDDSETYTLQAILDNLMAISTTTTSTSTSTSTTSTSTTTTSTSTTSTSTTAPP